MSITVSAAAPAAMPWTCGRPSSNYRSTLRCWTCADAWVGPCPGCSFREVRRGNHDITDTNDPRKGLYHACALTEPRRPYRGAPRPNSGMPGTSATKGCCKKPHVGDRDPAMHPCATAPDLAALIGPRCGSAFPDGSGAERPCLEAALASNWPRTSHPLGSVSPPPGRAEGGNACFSGAQVRVPPVV